MAFRKTKRPFRNEWSFYRMNHEDKGTKHHEVPVVQTLQNMILKPRNLVSWRLHGFPFIRIIFRGRVQSFDKLRIITKSLDIRSLLFFLHR